MLGWSLKCENRDCGPGDVGSSLLPETMRCSVCSDWSEGTSLSMRFVHALEKRVQEGISSETLSAA